MSDQTLTTADLSEYSALSIDALGRVFQPEWLRTFEPNINRNQQRHWARQRAIRDGQPFEGAHSRSQVVFPTDRPCIARLVPSAEADTAA